MKHLLFFLAICVIPMSSFVQKGLKYAHVNSDQILAEMSEVKEGQDKIRLLAEKYKTEFQQEEQRLAMYGQSIQNSDTTLAAKQALAIDYENQVIAYRQKVAEKEQELIDMEKQLVDEVSIKVKAAIEIVAQDENINYVFDTNSITIWYDKGGMDITTKVKKELGITTE